MHIYTYGSPHLSLSTMDVEVRSVTHMAWQDNSLSSWKVKKRKTHTHTHQHRQQKFPIQTVFTISVLLRYIALTLAPSPPPPSSSSIRWILISSVCITHSHFISFVLYSTYFFSSLIWLHSFTMELTKSIHSFIDSPLSHTHTHIHIDTQFTCTTCTRCVFDNWIFHQIEPAQRATQSRLHASASFITYSLSVVCTLSPNV